jgi:SOS-response transcriptional repressor LexA
MNELTKKQSALFNFIMEFRNRYGYSPSRDEMAAKLGISKTSVKKHLNSMRKKKYVTWDYAVSRSIRPDLS